MKKIFDILPIKTFNIEQQTLQIELENSVKFDEIYWSKDSLTTAVKIKPSHIQLDDKHLTIELKNGPFKPFVNYYLLAKINGLPQRFYQANHAQYSRAERHHDLGEAEGSLHKVLFLNDFGNIGLKFVPQIILDTYDRRLPLNIELSDLVVHSPELAASYTIEWPSDRWQMAEQTRAFLTALNSPAAEKIYATDASVKFDRNQAQIKARFDTLSDLTKEKDYAFGLEIPIRGQTYTLLATRVSLGLFEKFNPLYQDINLVPEDRVSFTFTPNAAITLRRKINFRKAATFPSLANDFEKKQYLTKAEKLQIKENYSTLETQWINQSAYHNFTKEQTNDGIL